ncbi:MAG: hypothetical protein JW737_06955 [Acidobacteria bacterium]|nr:hypothetical protein [Acidobacteriota bacterium]
MMTTAELTYKKIFWLWVPLALTWAMMAAEVPFITGVIARLASAKYNLAAFGVAMAIGMIVEAPIIMIFSTTVALTKDKDSFIKIWRFLFTLNLAITAIILVIVFPPVFRFIANDVLRLPPEVAKLTHLSTLFMLPWPAAIGFRRLYQGILIRFGLTRRVTFGTMTRLTTGVITALALYKFTDLPGAYIGTITLSTAVTVEAIATRLMTQSSICALKCGDVKLSAGKHNRESLTYRFIVKYYIPLALSSMLGIGMQPIITFFMGQSRYPVESLAVLPVLNAFIFIFRSFGLSYLEVSLAMLGDDNIFYRKLRNFAYTLGLILMSLYILVVFTPLGRIWLTKVAGLKHELVDFSVLPMQLAFLLPAQSALLSLQRSVLLNSNRTRFVSLTAGIEVTTIFLLLFLNIKFFNLVGAVAAIGALATARILSTTYQQIMVMRTLRS